MAKSVLDTQVYDLDYFSGSQMFLYIGNVWLDEVTSLQYTTQQIKTPIYGYASQLWDDCAAGHVLVQGQFSINFKEQGYLWATLRRTKNVSSEQAYAGAEGIKNIAKKDKRLGITRAPRDRRPIWGSNATRVSRQSLERIMQGRATKGEEYQFYQDLAGYATFDVASPRDKIFEDVVEYYEDQIWAKGVTNDRLKTQIRRTDDNRFDGFDIYVVFGNYANPRANHTVQKIIDVHRFHEVVESSQFHTFNRYLQVCVSG